MSDRKETRKYRYYKCGQCKAEIEYARDSEPPIPCPDCGWSGGTRDKYDVPENIKYRIN